MSNVLHISPAKHTKFRSRPVVTLQVINPTGTSTLVRLALVPTSTMDTDIGTELFAGYENDFNLIIADISTKLQGAQDQDGEARKAAVRAAERAADEAEEIVASPPPASPEYY
jgi:hypothetical protein